MKQLGSQFSSPKNAVEKIPWKTELTGKVNLNVFEAIQKDNIPFQNWNIFYEELLDDTWKFQARFNQEEREIIEMQFKIIGRKDNRIIADFQLDIDEMSYYPVNHRLVTSQDYGITGSEVWCKVEKILSTLFENGAIPERPVHITSRNLLVINWCLRNDFRFKYDEANDLWEEYRLNPEKFVAFSPQSNFADTKTGTYIIKKCDETKIREGYPEFESDIDKARDVAIPFTVEKNLSID